MIFGRPINLWTGLVTAVLGAAQTIGVVVLKTDPVATATVLGSVGIVLGSVIAIVATQPPTVVSGGTVNVQTPSGQPNATAELGVTGAGEVTVSQ